MRTDQRWVLGIATSATLAALAWELSNNGAYGLTLFVALPIVVGAFGAWIDRSKTAMRAANAGMVANMIASVGFLVAGEEGLVCIFLALPLAIPLGALGGWLAFSCGQKKSVASGTAMLLLIPFGLGTAGFDAVAKPNVFEVHSSIEIAAPPERVWKNVVSFSELPPPSEWYFKTGIAYPIRAHIDGAGPGAIRYCEFSTGPFVEPIQVWDEPHLLRFNVTQNPAPMNEWSPYAHVMPRHLHGYMVSKQGQFLLTLLPNGHTLLEGTTWYQHGLWPEQYWTLWSHAIIHRIHMRVLTHIKNLSESETQG